MKKGFWHRFLICLLAVVCAAVCMTACGHQEAVFYQKSGFQPLAYVDGSPTFFDQEYVDAYLRFRQKYLASVRQKLERDYDSGALTQAQYDEKIAAYEFSKKQITGDRLLKEIVQSTALERTAAQRGLNLAKETNESLKKAKEYTQNYQEVLAVDLQADAEETTALFNAFLDDLEMTHDQYASSYLAYSFYIQSLKEKVKADMIAKKELPGEDEAQQDQGFSAYLEQLYEQAEVEYTS